MTNRNWALTQDELLEVIFGKGRKRSKQKTPRHVSKWEVCRGGQVSGMLRCTR